MGCGSSTANVKKPYEAMKNDEKINALIIAVNKTSIITQDKKLEDNAITSSNLAGLALKPTKFYKEKIGLSPTDFMKPRTKYEEIGQFDYANENYTDDLKEKVGKSKSGIKWIYVGQFKAGTNIKDGIGITVWESGDT